MNEKYNDSYQNEHIFCINVHMAYIQYNTKAAIATIKERIKQKKEDIIEEM